VSLVEAVRRGNAAVLSGDTAGNLLDGDAAQ
jgi:hypothetical protein